MSGVYDVLIVGAGPAGMMAGISAKNNSNNVLILEKNSSAGVKLLLTGKGRCNVTTTKDIDDIIEAFGPTGKFLHGSLSRFSNRDLMSFFETRDVELKEERGKRVFPKSDNAKDILNCLLNELQRPKIKINYDVFVRSTKKESDVFIVTTKKATFKAKNLIITTGGVSYPETGSSGDGYKFAKVFGHNVITPIPALAPLITNDKDVTILSGLSLKNIIISFSSANKIFAKEFGEMLFTHRGISGPVVLKCTRLVHEHLDVGEKVICRIDMKPRLDEKTLKKRIIKEINNEPKKEYKSLLTKLLPKSLVLYTANQTQIDVHQQSSTLKKDQIISLIEFLKYFEINIEGVDSIKRAIVTHGGVDIKEINPKTMQSKLIKGLYFAGEIICLDGPTGGFNLTKAFSTGYVAGHFSSLSNNIHDSF